MRRDLRSRLRPMNFTDILDETIELYKSNFILLVGIAAIVYIPYYLLNAALPQPMYNAKTDPTQFVSSMIAIYTLTILFYVIVHPIATGALTLAISERYLSKEITIKECYRRILQKRVILPFMVANLLVGAVIFSIFIVVGIIVGGSIGLSFIMDNVSTSVLVLVISLCVIIGTAAIWFIVHSIVRFTLVAPVFIVEMNGAKNSLKRSWTLMKGNVGKALGLLIVVGIVISVISGVVAGPAAIMSGMNASAGKEPSSIWIALSTIISALVSTLTAPLSSIVTILLYYDIRIRKEGFDLELLAKELDDRTREMGASDITALPQEQIPVQNPTDSE